MRELQVLTDGHLKLPFADTKEFFEEEMLEQVRSQVKLLLERAMLAEQDRYLVTKLGHLPPAACLP